MDKNLHELPQTGVDKLLHEVSESKSDDNSSNADNLIQDSAQLIYSDDKWRALLELFKKVSSDEPKHIVALRLILAAALMLIVAGEVFFLLYFMFKVLDEPTKLTDNFVSLLRVLIPTIFAEILAIVVIIIKFLFTSNIDRTIELLIEVVKSSGDRE